jgi:hypothetical protein
MSRRHVAALADLRRSPCARGGGRHGGVPLPELLVGWIVRDFDPTPRLRRLPMMVSVAPIRIRRERLEVGDEAGPVGPPKEGR